MPGEPCLVKSGPSYKDTIASESYYCGYNYKGMRQLKQKNRLLLEGTLRGSVVCFSHKSVEYQHSFSDSSWLLNSICLSREHPPKPLTHIFRVLCWVSGGRVGGWGWRLYVPSSHRVWKRHINLTRTFTRAHAHRHEAMGVLGPEASCLTLEAGLEEEEVECPRGWGKSSFNFTGVAFVIV